MRPSSGEQYATWVANVKSKIFDSATRYSFALWDSKSLAKIGEIPHIVMHEKGCAIMMIFLKKIFVKRNCSFSLSYKSSSYSKERRRKVHNFIDRLRNFTSNFMQAFTFSKLAQDFMLLLVIIIFFWNNDYYAWVIWPILEHKVYASNQEFTSMFVVNENLDGLLVARARLQPLLPRWKHDPHRFVIYSSQVGPSKLILGLWC